MKLSSFPYLVQKEIFDHLTINNIFFLSLCSRNTKNLITQTQKYQFQKVEHVDYWITPKAMTISVKTVSRVDNDLVMSLFSTPAEFEKFMLGHEDSDLVEEIQVDVFGTSIDLFRSRANRSDLHAKYCSNNLESTIEAVHNCLYDLLGDHTRSWLTSICEETHRLPMLRNMQMLGIYGGVFESERIDEIMFNSACFEYLATIECHERTNSLRKNSKVNKLETVHATTGCSLATDVMKHFNGRHVFFSGHYTFTTDAVLFLNAWKSGEKFRNLEVMSIDKDDHFDIPWIRRWGVEFKEVDTEVEYAYVRKLRQRDPTRAFKSNLYLVRESDGHVASVLLTPTQIIMGVWNLTETQFLERFQ